MTKLEVSLTQLESIQEIDIKIYSILKIKKENPAKLTPLASEIAGLKKKTDDQTKTVAEIDRVKKQAMGQLEINEDRIARADKRTSMLRTEYELKANEKEIESLKKYNGELKETIAKQDTHLTAAREILTQLETEYQSKTSGMESLKKDMENEDSSIDAQLQVLEKKRSELVPGVEPRVLSTYDRIKVAKNGQGLAIAKDGKCLGCNVTLPSQIFIEMSKFMDLESCPSCKRILFPKK